MPTKTTRSSSRPNSGRAASSRRRKPDERSDSETDDDVTFTQFDDDAIDFDDDFSDDDSSDDQDAGFGDDEDDMPAKKATKKTTARKKATKKKAAKKTAAKATKKTAKKATRSSIRADDGEGDVDSDVDSEVDDIDAFGDEETAPSRTKRKTATRKKASAKSAATKSAGKATKKKAAKKATKSNTKTKRSARETSDDEDAADDTDSGGQTARSDDRKPAKRSRRTKADDDAVDDAIAFSEDDGRGPDDETEGASDVTTTASKTTSKTKSKSGKSGKSGKTAKGKTAQTTKHAADRDEFEEFDGDGFDDGFGDDSEEQSDPRGRRSRRSRDDDDQGDFSDDPEDRSEDRDADDDGGSRRTRSRRSRRSRGESQGRSDQNGSSRSDSSESDGDSQPRRRRRRRGRRGKGGDEARGPNQQGGGQQGGGQQSKRSRRARGGQKGQPKHGPPAVSKDYSDAAGPCEGVLELHPIKGYGFLRDKENDYAAQEADPFVSVQLIERYCLREGVHITGEIGPGHRNQGPRLKEIETIEGMPADDFCEVVPFDKLTPINPTEQIKLEMGPSPITMRVMDLLAPIGKGQRALIVAPPRSGKTILLQQIADSVAHNHPECHLMVVLIDERPEEVTDMRRHVKGDVIASSMDRDLENHVRISQLVIERAKRLAERGEDVFILLDSITRTARAFNKYTNSGRTGSGGVDVRAMDIPKKLFGTARLFDEGGSVTVVGTALIETGGRMDDVIFQEFKGTGNMELVLSRDLADRRIFPAIDIGRTGTRREELLLEPETLDGVTMMRRSLLSLHPVEAMETLIRALAKYDTNAEFLKKVRAML